VTNDNGRCSGATKIAVRGRHALAGHKSNDQKQSLLLWRRIEDGLRAISLWECPARLIELARRDTPFPPSEASNGSSAMNSAPDTKPL
jgi:hypothetical protein